MANCIMLVRIVIAPTAISPPYFSSDELKQTEITLSLACIMNVDSPNATQGSTSFGAAMRFSFLRRRIVFLPVRKYMTHTQEMPCEMTVASAAPRTPILSPKINIGSSVILAIAPIMTVHMLMFAKPCAVIKAFMPSVSCTNIVPAA